MAETVAADHCPHKTTTPQYQQYQTGEGKKKNNVRLELSMIVTVLSEGKYNGILSDVIASHENCPPPPGG